MSEYAPKSFIKEELPQESAEGVLSQEDKRRLELMHMEARSLPLAGLYLHGTRLDCGDIPIQPGTWNENSGVILYADSEGRSFVMPSRDDDRRWLFESGMKKDTTIGVPGFNNLEVWGTQEQRERATSFQRWMELLEMQRQVKQAKEDQELIGKTYRVW